MDASQDAHDPTVWARRLIALQYFARLPSRHSLFRWPDAKTLLQVQDNLYDDLLLNNCRDKDAAAYTQSFLKELIARLESAVGSVQDADIETNAELLEVYADLMASPCSASRQPESITVIHYFPAATSQSRQNATPINAHPLFPGLEAICTHEEGTTISRGTTGLKTWEASLRLAAHLTAHPDVMLQSQPGKHAILELGCGLGFLGVLVAKHLQAFIASQMQDSTAHAQRQRVILSDLQGEVLQRAKQTVEANSLSQTDPSDNDSSVVQTEVVALDWLDVLHNSQNDACAWLNDLLPSVILAADIVFEPALIDPLCAVLSSVLFTPSLSNRSIKPVAYIASTVRNDATFQRFKESLESHSLLAEEIIMSQPLLDLETLQLIKSINSATMADQVNSHTLPLFPSVHASASGGRVVLLRVTSLPERDSAKRL